jgi:hypothetical protein
VGEVVPINRIVLPGQPSEGPAIPESFVAQLRQYDPTLLVAWNGIRKRFVIEKCDQHLSGVEAHTHLCRRSFVVMAQDDDGVMMPLGDRVMDKIRAADVTNAGYGPDDLARFLADQKAVFKKYREDIDAKSADAIRHGSRINKRQLLKAIHLIQQHDLRVNQ